MPIHVAILKKPYIDLVVDGQKTVESRLTQNALPPYRMIQLGERIYFKESCGPFRAMGVADTVEFHEGLTPSEVNAIRRKWNDRICGDDAYWKLKANRRYASLISLRDVEPIDFAPRFTKSNGLAWFVLDETCDPMFETVVTRGAIRNGYLSVPPAVHAFPASGFELELPDGQRIKTEIARGGMMRKRGWLAIYKSHGVRVGDRVRFVQTGRHRYRILFPDV